MLPEQTSGGVAFSAFLAEVSAAAATQSKLCSFVKVLVPVLFQGCGDFGRAFVAKESSWTIRPPPSKSLLHPRGRAKAYKLPGGPALVDVESSMRPGRKGELGPPQCQAPHRPSHNPERRVPPGLIRCSQHQPHPLGDKTGDLDSAELSLSEAGLSCLV